MAAIVVVYLTACETDYGSSDNGDNKNDVAAVEAEQKAATPPAESSPPPSAASGIIWLDADVSGWPETAKLDASVDGSSVKLDYSKSHSWPTEGGDANANAWIIVNKGGVLYAATWEWLKFGQESKAKSSVGGGHINHAPLAGFHPKSGEIYGLMVSSLARDDRRTVNERSNIDFVRWP
jgi:hypothetical protein